MHNISTISEELDNFTEKNNKLIEILKSGEEVIKIKAEIQQVKKENKILRGRIAENQKNKKFNKVRTLSENKRGNIFSCFNKDEEDRYTISFNKKKK